MKEVLLFHMPGCPHCRKAFQLMQTLREENPKYQAIEVKLIDETAQPDYADQFDYWYVPTFYVDGNKYHEGVITLEDVRRVFDAALA